MDKTKNAFYNIIYNNLKHKKYGRVDIKYIENIEQADVYKDYYQNWNIYAKSYKRPAIACDTTYYIDANWFETVYKKDIALLNNKYIVLFANQIADYFVIKYCYQSVGATVNIEEGYLFNNKIYKNAHTLLKAQQQYYNKLLKQKKETNKKISKI